MATSGTIKTTCGSSNHYDFWADWKRNSVDISNNKSNITISLKLKRNDGVSSGAYNLDTKPTVTLKVGGTSKTPTISHIDTRNGKTCTFATWTGNVTHDDDGSLDLKISASFTMTGSSSLSSGSLSGTASVDTIPRASEPTLSASSVVMGNTVTITTNRKSNSFTHDITYSFNGYTGTIANGVGASYTWSVPDLVSKISGKESGTCTISCKTKNGSTVIGTKKVTLTLKIPVRSVPSASASTVQMGTSVTIYTNRKSTGFTHKLSYLIGGTEGTIGASVGGSVAWTPPKSLAKFTERQTSGICTITCETYNGTYLVGTAETKIVLTVPNATVVTLNKSSIVLGENITINTPREVDCYEHDISYTLNAKDSSTVAFSKDFSGAVQESYVWTPSLILLAPAIPSATEGTITLTCKTRFKDSTTVVGTSTVSFTVKVPNNSTTQPKLDMTLTPMHSLSSAFDGVYVQGKSKVNVTHSAESDYSTIASYKTEILGKTGSGKTYTSAILSNAGAVTIKGTVTDARGYSTTKTVSINVVPYSRPRVIPGENQSSIICTRCNSNGTVDPGGVYLLIKAGRMYSKVVSGTQKNFCKLSYSYKTDSEDKYSNPVELLLRTATTDYVSVKITDKEFDDATAYNVKLIAEDDIGETDTVIITIPTAFATYHAPPDGHGFTLGGYHDPSKIDVFDCRFDAEFEGDVSGRVLGMGALPEIPPTSDLNNYKDFGAYSIAKNATAQFLLNCPSKKAGTLRVWSANGRGDTTGDYVYIMQEYITYDNSETYRRSMQLPNPESAWEYGEWKVVSSFIEGSTLVSGMLWYWRKYANGEAECWGRKNNSSRDITTQFGNMYYADCDEVNFPFSFYTAPMVNATVESGSALILMSWQGTDGNGTTTATKPASYRVIRPTTITGASFKISYHAIGRWKE